MNGETRIWLLSVFLFVSILYADSQYECGASGKFEYCIDGAPGCVIGCHCHPGYYFDTDTKICEPNIKLTKDLRRQYFSEPTRVQNAPITPPPEAKPSSDTPDVVEEKVDEITKDADDLGDWLYNQFFKTIENQVINKTQGEELKLPTRRSGDILLKKPSRRSHKYWNGKKKKKGKSKKLKSKLLRITEDDSLFNSDSESLSNADESSSSSGSDGSYSREDRRVRKKDDHGHKKILIFNKKPQPPLPSFIFLPNMNSPYYQPMGLPPPPVMPMYPMVPVPPMLPGPPMGGPLFPYPGVPTCEDNNVTTSTASTVLTTTPISTSDPIVTTDLVTDPTSPEAPTDTESTPESPAEAEETPATEDPQPLRKRHKKFWKKPLDRPNTGNGSPVHLTMQRNKLLKKLREKINRKNKLENYIADQFEESGAPVDVNDPSIFVPKQHFMMPNMNEMTPSTDVDFKYLAELIHKTDMNKTLNTRPNANYQNIHNLETALVNPLQNRKSNYSINNNRPINNVIRQKSRMEDPNDSFYTNLGKQIASMIRKIDLMRDRDVNIETGANSMGLSQTSPVFNENNYASRSFWERSVRSPLKIIKNQMDHLKKSNEDLFSLEDKVERAVSTARTLSLRDLENIISTVKKVQLKPKRTTGSRMTDYSNSSFKLNLLPGNIQTLQSIPKPRSRPKPKQKPVQHFVQIDSDVTHERIKQSDPNSGLLSNFRQLSPDYDDTTTHTANRKYTFPDLRTTRHQNKFNIPEVISPTTHLFTNIKPTFMKETVDNTNLKYQLSPVLINHRSLNYHYTRNSNPYLFDSELPIQNTRLSDTFHYGQDKASYFHHDFHHFDYFD